MANIYYHIIFYIFLLNYTYRYLFLISYNSLAQKWSNAISNNSFFELVDRVRTLVSHGYH